LEAEELDLALDELELRLERLRALYEQYFLGIEKIEPQVLRKDVDRRIHLLRREKIRNTGKRFKLQTIIQRYNTFQQYWQRICREIENGTYRRHLLRAEKAVGPGILLTAAARRRFGKGRDEDKAPSAPPTDAPPPRAGFSEMPSDEVTHRMLNGPMPSSAPPAASPSTRPRSRTPTLPGFPTPPPSAPPNPPPLPEFPRQPLVGPAIPRAVPPPLGPRAAPSPQPLAASVSADGARARPSRSPKSGAPIESLELDMDFMGDWDPRTAATDRNPVARGFPPARQPQPSRPEAPVAAPPVVAPSGLGTPAPRNAPRAAPPPKPQRALPVESLPREPAAAELVRGPAAGVATSPAADRLVAPAPTAKTFAVTPRAGSSSSAVSPAPAAPLESPAPASPAATAAPTPVSSPADEPSRPAKPHRPKPGRPHEAAARPPTETSVSDGRMKELHSRFVEVSKGAGGPAVSYDGLAKSLRAAEAKLRAKHGDRRIDFEVILKDGKAALKPVVR
jgi:hypothetical protein